MTVKRVMGTETEYAVSQTGSGSYQPVQLSFDVVSGAADPDRRHIRWDYRQEDPVNDARGHRLERAAARPDMLTDAPQLNVTNVIAPNGGRIYVDHAHPEYSAPETTDPFAAVAWDHAGDRLMLAAARAASRATGCTIVLHRNNVDGKGASWGTHESYMMDRSVPFSDVAALMTAHFVSRQIWAGSGRVGIGETSETAGYQLSQRADYLQSRIGLQTTFDRPIVNTRDESHSPAASRRLHVIVGDANRMEAPQAAKLGSTSMLLWLLEHADEAGFDLPGLLGRLELADPVAALHTVSRDLTLTAELPLAAGGTITAWQMQVTLRAAVYEAAAAIYGTDTAGEPAWPDKPTRETMALWGQLLADVASIRHAEGDDARLRLSEEPKRIEWLFKWQLLEKLRRKVGGDWASPKLAAVDLSWAALEPDQSVFAKLEGRTEHVVADTDIVEAMAHAPEDTRAWLRAEVVRRWPDQTVAASWSHLAVRIAADDNGGACGGSVLPEVYGNASAAAPASGAGARGAAGGDTLFDFDMADPLAWNRRRCAAEAERSHTAGELLSRLAEGNRTNR